nr:hypothetical protein [Tanacetum cinerariifolium]
LVVIVEEIIVVVVVLEEVVRDVVVVEMVEGHDGVNTPRSDEDRLELMKLTVFLLPKVGKVRIGVSAVDLQVSAVKLMLLLLVQKFLLFVVVKKVNDVIRLQSLVDKKKVVVTEATIRDALRLDDAEGVECLPNEEFFAELARMGYEKLSTKLTFYKEFFSSQWKFLIHTILQCMSAKRTSWNEFSSSMASVVICISSGRKFNFSKYTLYILVRNVDSPTKFYMYPRFLQLIIRKQVGDLSTHTTKYTSPALTQKVFANMRRVGKRFFEVETSLFEGMLVAQEVGKGVADAEHDEGVPAAGVVTKGDVSAAHDDVPTIAKEPSIPSLTPPTPPPQPSQDIHSTSQAQPTPPQSPQGRMIADMDADADVVLEEVKEVATDAKADQVEAKVNENVDIQRRTTESQAEIYKIDLEHANKVLSMQEDEYEPAELQEVVYVVTTAKIITKVVTSACETITAASITITAAEAQVPVATLTAAPSRVTAAPSRRRTKGVVIRDPKESTTTTSTIIHTKAKSKDKGKGILAKEDPAVKRYQALKRKPQTEAQARKNMMVYLKNTNEQIEEEESRALKRINETLAERAAKRQKLDEEVEELKRHLQIVPNEDDDVYTEATPLPRKVSVVDYEVINMNNKPYYKIIRADDTHQLYSEM